MNDQKFSDSKSALHDYFQSLLSEDEDIAIEKDEAVVIKQHDVVELYPEESENTVQVDDASAETEQNGFPSEDVISEGLAELEQALAKEMSETTDETVESASEEPVAERIENPEAITEELSPTANEQEVREEESGEAVDMAAAEESAIDEPDAEEISTATNTPEVNEDASEKIAEKAAVEESVSIEPPVTLPSVEEMLASVEEKAQTSPAEALPEFAEPEPAIEIPLPKVAPPVIEEPAVNEPVVQEQVVVETVTETEITVDEDSITNVDIGIEHAAEPPKLDSSVPDWAEQPFQCLLFNVGGLALAVPLVKLNGVIPWSENVVETPNQTDWYLGVLMNHGNKVQVIDTAVMVLPAEHREDMPVEPEERLSHILLVDDQRWGLACDSIGDVVWLKKDEVKWRSNKTKRPWLLGTAVDHMCAVMDTDAFAGMLQSQQ